MFYNKHMEPLSGIPPTALVLVAVMTSPRDLEIARLLGWYRIPLRTAPKVVDVDYLAFYQTSSFPDDEKGTIRYVAKVRGHELTTRGELLKDEKDHPRAAEEYYKVQIGQLIKLPRPISASNWKRVTFLYTTGKTLMEAVTLNDLVIHSEERSLLWNSMRERLGGENRKENDPDELEFSEEQLLEILGYIGLPHILKP